MSLVRLLPAWLHAVADYAVALTLIVVALAVGGTGLAVATGVVVGAVVLVVSMLTRYPLGVVKVLPFQVHSAGDYLAAALLIGSPFALGFTSSDRGLTIVYVAAGVAVLGVSLITNYQYGTARQVVRVAEAPTADDRSEANRWFAASAQYGSPTRDYAPDMSSLASTRDPDMARLAPAQTASAQTASAQTASAQTAARPLREILAERAAAAA
jgi:hypothetical protein